MSAALHAVLNREPWRALLTKEIEVEATQLKMNYVDVILL